MIFSPNHICLCEGAFQSPNQAFFDSAHPLSKHETAIFDP